LELGPEQIEPAPKIGTKLNTDFIKGMGKADEKFIILLNIDKIFSAEELATAQGTVSKAEIAEAVAVQ